MKILLTGSTGYIGRRLLPELVKAGHFVVCPVRDTRRFDYEDFDERFLTSIEVITIDFLNEVSLQSLPKDIDAAYYLIHSLNATKGNFSHQEAAAATNFSAYISQTTAKQVIYLGGIVNEQEELSNHLSSRHNVERILGESSVPLTVLRSAIIIGSGSASFEIIRDIVEKLPIMITPKWLNSRCQPIGIFNVLTYLIEVLFNDKTYGKVFDIGGKDILTYKEMLLTYAKYRGLNRLIITLPVLSIKLSSLWLYLVTSTSYRLARNLVDSMKNEVIVLNEEIKDIIPIELFSYEESLRRTFQKIEQNQIISSWKDSFSSQSFSNAFLHQIEAPKHGCFQDIKSEYFERDPKEIIENVWSIGGERGWYYGNFLWRLRGTLDKLVGGVGLRRGRRSPNDLKGGDALDFWRVLYANKEEKRLLLYAEMKLPGDAWLEFKIRKENNQNCLIQTATFRPWGVWGRLYWFLVLPFHGFIFSGMVRKLIAYNE